MCLKLAHKKWLGREREWEPQQVVAIGGLGTCTVTLMVQLHRQVFSVFPILDLLCLNFSHYPHLATCILFFFFPHFFCLLFWLITCHHLCNLSCPKVIHSAVETTKQLTFCLSVDCIHFAITIGILVGLHGQISYWCGCERQGLLWAEKGVETQVKERPHAIYFQPWTNMLWGCG